MKAWKKFECDPLFKHSNETLSLDEQRRLALLRMYKIVETKVFPFDEIVSNPKLVNIVKNKMNQTIVYFIMFMKF